LERNSQAALDVAKRPKMTCADFSLAGKKRRTGKPCDQSIEGAGLFSTVITL